MMIRILKYVGTTAVGLFLAALVFALPYRWYLQHRIAEGRAIRSSDGIDSLVAVQIGGIDQWIHVRGQNVNNPILLFIHGGPGVAFIPLAGEVQGPWERHFTVVQWDQRGAGKTYATNDTDLQRRTMTVARMEQDALEVVNHLRNRFKRDKVFLVGHSWGTVLGLWLAHEHPDIIDAYVGVAQFVNGKLNAKTAFEDALEILARGTASTRSGTSSAFSPIRLQRWICGKARLLRVGKQNYSGRRQIGRSTWT